MMALRAAPLAQNSESFLNLEQLPGEAQALVCSQASTPSCPAHVLLARVSRAWAAVAADHFRFSGGSIELVLPCDKDSVVQQQQEQAEQRLQHLAKWLRQYGQYLTTLSIQPSGTVEEQECRLFSRDQGVKGVMEALAAAAKRPGGLPLHQLTLPAFGVVTSHDISKALSSCRRLRLLRLGCSSGADALCATEYLEWGQYGLVGALQQLTQLTLLELKFGEIQHRMNLPVQLDGILQALPSTLVALDLACTRRKGTGVALRMHTSSLQHLVGLQVLGLPRVWCTASSRGAAADLAHLTALTHLSHDRALEGQRGSLLSLPRLVVLVARDTWRPGLQALAGRTTLRALTCTMDVSAWEATAAALAQLTQLTELRLLVENGEDGVPANSQMWGQTLAALTGLRSLSVEPEVLQHVKMSALTALQQLSIPLDWSQCTTEQLVDLVHGLPPALGVCLLRDGQPLQVNPRRSQQQQQQEEEEQVEEQQQQQQQQQQQPRLQGQPQQQTAAVAPAVVVGGQEGMLRRLPTWSGRAPAAVAEHVLVNPDHQYATGTAGGAHVGHQAPNLAPQVQGWSLLAPPLEHWEQQQQAQCATVYSTGQAQPQQNPTMSWSQWPQHQVLARGPTHAWNAPDQHQLQQPHHYGPGNVHNPHWLSTQHHGRVVALSGSGQQQQPGWMFGCIQPPLPALQWQQQQQPGPMYVLCQSQQQQQQQVPGPVHVLCQSQQQQQLCTSWYAAQHPPPQPPGHLPMLPERHHSSMRWAPAAQPTTEDSANMGHDQELQPFPVQLPYSVRAMYCQPPLPAPQPHQQQRQQQQQLVSDSWWGGVQSSGAAAAVAGAWPPPSYQPLGLGGLPPGATHSPPLPVSSTGRLFQAPRATARSMAPHYVSQPCCVGVHLHTAGAPNPPQHGVIGSSSYRGGEPCIRGSYPGRQQWEEHGSYGSRDGYWLSQGPGSCRGRGLGRGGCGHFVEGGSGVHHRCGDHFGSRSSGPGPSSDYGVCQRPGGGSGGHGHRQGLGGGSSSSRGAGSGYESFQVPGAGGHGRGHASSCWYPEAPGPSSCGCWEGPGSCGSRGPVSGPGQGSSAGRSSGSGAYHGPGDRSATWDGSWARGGYLGGRYRRPCQGGELQGGG